MDIEDINYLDKKFDHLKQRLATLDSKLLFLDKRVDKLSDNIFRIHSKIENARQDTITRMTRLETEHSIHVEEERAKSKNNYKIISLAVVIGATIISMFQIILQ